MASARLESISMFNSIIRSLVLGGKKNPSLKFRRMLKLTTMPIFDGWFISNKQLLIIYYYDLKFRGDANWYEPFAAQIEAEVFRGARSLTTQLTDPWLMSFRHSVEFKLIIIIMATSGCRTQYELSALLIFEKVSQILGDSEFL